MMGRGKPVSNAEWLAFAARDLRAAGVLLDQPEPLVEQALFHCPQAAEKALKSVRVGAGEMPPRIHHLTTLLDLCMVHRPDLAVLRADAESLSTFAVLPRYPDISQTYTLELGRHAFQASRRVLVALGGAL